MLTNLDIWAIQYYPECLETALDNIKKKEDIQVYCNCISEFTIMEKSILDRRFDTVLYSQANDLLVMLMEGRKSKRYTND